MIGTLTVRAAPSPPFVKQYACSTHQNAPHEYLNMSIQIDGENICLNIYNMTPNASP
jgi:hypothetical protein